MHALALHGDERAIEPVCDRVRAALSRERKTNYGAHSEVTYALMFLDRWRGRSSRVDETVRWVRDKAFDRLLPPERVFFHATFGG